jgi:hypothetical protein
MPTDSCSPPTTAPEVLVIEATGTRLRGGHESGPVVDSSLADKDPPRKIQRGPAPDPAPHSQVALPTKLNNSDVK